jgi:hypothetical protein
MINMNNISNAYVNSGILNASFSSASNGSFANLTQSLLQPNTNGLSATSTPGDLQAAATQSLLGATFGYAQDNTISTLTQSLLAPQTQAVDISETAQKISDIYNKVRSSGNNNAVEGMNAVISNLIENNQDPVTFLNSVKNLSTADITSVMATANTVEKAEIQQTGKSTQMSAWISQTTAAFAVSEDAGKEVISATKTILNAPETPKQSNQQLLSDYIKANQAIADWNVKDTEKATYYKKLAETVQVSTNIKADISSFYAVITNTKPTA